MKKVCGIGITGKSASIVILEGNKEDFKVLKIDVKKIDLEDDLLQESMKSFSSSIHDIFKDNSIEAVYIKRPSTTGRFRASHSAFKIETVIQLGTCQVNLVTAQSIAALLKKDTRMDEVKNDVLKYQIPALEAGFYGLNE